MMDGAISPPERSQGAKPTDLDYFPLIPKNPLEFRHIAKGLFHVLSIFPSLYPLPVLFLDFVFVPVDSEHRV